MYKFVIKCVSLVGVCNMFCLFSEFYFIVCIFLYLYLHVLFAALA